MFKVASFVLGLFAMLAGTAGAEPLTVFAAASLTDAMKAVSTAWEKQGHPAPRLSFAASSALARQIENGAPANIFASADLQWMDYLAKAGLIAPDTRVNLLGNELVLIVPKDRAREVEITPDLDVRALLGAEGRLATGDPASVPVGIYAKQAFTKLGLWNRIEPRLARAVDVRGALILVGRGEAEAGVVYSTDAAASPDVSIAGRFPEGSHDPVIYPFAVTKDGDTAEARAFLAFLNGEDARAIFKRFGFRTR